MSGYYASLKRLPSQRSIQDWKLLFRIRQIFKEHKGRYGSPRIYDQLIEEKWRVSRKRVRAVPMDW